ncbi:MAG: GIY-YIG nuclease family protein [Rhodoferax sp.]|uniref:GIY-YIG nuclease family protein n=1 Tax=Rhodoferax sp. TaxID=50421 RepID=UPI00271ADB7F|nr:GIY-YIG nuclease family protein [Rhodoferax sp.]MDO8449514.1 GIY-YIG nuclease family protein [Rhodoferax sp.]
MPRPQTIQIFLPAGDPRGMRVAEITTRIVRVIEVPRSQLAEFVKTPEALQVGVYFLMGELSEAGLPRVYIGQSGSVGNRLVQHNQNKDFWNRALVVISLTNSMTQTHALFLEWFAIQQATQAGRYSLENGNTGARPHTPAPLEADCHEIHETAATLLATLGQPIFEPLTNAPTARGELELFYCRGSGADGVGEYTSEGFVVLKGSRGRVENVASIQGTSNVRIREQLQTDGVTALNDGMLVFTRDHLFPSPSMAAMALMGRSANGWVEWKSPQGKTLDELKRQTVAPTA